MCKLMVYHPAAKEWNESCVQNISHSQLFAVVCEAHQSQPKPVPKCQEQGQNLSDVHTQGGDWECPDCQELMLYAYRKLGTLPKCTSSEICRCQSWSLHPSLRSPHNATIAHYIHDVKG